MTAVFAHAPFPKPGTCRDLRTSNGARPRQMEKINAVEQHSRRIACSKQVQNLLDLVPVSALEPAPTLGLTVLVLMLHSA